MSFFKNIKNILIIIIILFIGYFIYDKLNPEYKEIKVPVKIEVPIPSVKGTSDTTKLPSPITIQNPLNKTLLKSNKELLKKNKSLSKELKISNTMLEQYKKSDSINKEDMYKQAISIKEYNETFIDSFQTISVYSKTRGTLLKQSIDYKTNKYTIPLDTTITTKIKNKFKVFGSLEIGNPLLSNKTDLPSIVVKPGIIFKNSKDNGISVSIDTRGYVWLGGIIKF